MLNSHLRTARIKGSFVSRINLGVNSTIDTLMCGWTFTTAGFYRVHSVWAENLPVAYNTITSTDMSNKRVINYYFPSPIFLVKMFSTQYIYIFYWQMQPHSTSQWYSLNVKDIKYCLCDSFSYYSQILLVTIYKYCISCYCSAVHLISITQGRLL